MTLKQQSKYERYQRILEVCKGKTLPSELITVYDINANKQNVNEAIRYDVRKSPRAYPGTSAGMVW